MNRHAHARRLGQNFLVHGRSAHRIVAALRLQPGEAVLEIGPGRGALTTRLIEAAGRIAAVELDPRLASALRARFDERQLLLLKEDILRVELREVCGLLRRERLVIAGNLPYRISKPVALKLVYERACADRAVLMFQREVAARLTAKPGSRDYGPLTVLAGQAFRITRLFDLPASFFRPAPKVVSSVTLWTPREESRLLEADLAQLRDCLAACFASRRKTLRNNLRAALGSEQVTERLLDAAGIDGMARAETLPPSAFLRLAALWVGR
jgi:16S rRNA (adenine1518-N6/adenine1519-N6)-dimethyltransferase